MTQYQLKLQLTPRQERRLNHWLRLLAAVWNWSIRKIEQDAQGETYYTSLEFRGLLNGHGAKMGLPQDALCGTLWTAHTAWLRCFQKIARKPRFKGRRNKLNSIAFAHGTRIVDGRLVVPYLGRIRFHGQQVPESHIGQFRLVKRASGWYACLCVQTEPNSITSIAFARIGIDPGFNSLLTLSSGEKVAHPRELEVSAARLAQAQRGRSKKLTGVIQEHIANQRKDRNHKVSRRLISENVFVVFSKDNIKGMSKRFGRSVASSGHAQLRQMLSYKSKRRTDGLGVYVEVDSRNSTKTCSTCQSLTGPTGLAGLSVRHWKCSACGAEHDRDINAAINTLNVGLGSSHETLATAA